MEVEMEMAYGIVMGGLIGGVMLGGFVGRSRWGSERFVLEGGVLFA